MKEVDKTILLSFAIALNVIGGKITDYLHLPIYFDVIGTILISIILGPIFGIKASFGNAILEFLFFGTNISTFFYLPVAIVISYTTYYIINGKEKNDELVLKSSYISILATITQRLISCIIFANQGIGKFWSIELFVIFFIKEVVNIFVIIWICNQIIKVIRKRRYL